jgi:uncharacterized protein (DUF2147 family)
MRGVLSIFCFLLMQSYAKHPAFLINAPDPCKGVAISGDAILGEWMDDAQTVKIAIYKQQTLYHAKIVWLRERQIAAIGTAIVKNLSYTGYNNWEGGRLFYPRTQKWYQCNCSLVSSNLLKLRVFSGIPVFGKTIYFKKAI